KNAAIDYDRSAVVQRAALAGRRRERIGAEVTAASKRDALQRQTGAAVDDEEPARVVAVEGDVVAVGIDESIPGDDLGRAENDGSIAMKTHQASTGQCRVKVRFVASEELSGGEGRQRRQERDT